MQFPRPPLIFLAYEALLLAWLISLRVRFDGWVFKDKFKDTEPIQHLQAVHLILATSLVAIAVWQARGREGVRLPGFVLLLSAFLWATNRELDGIWEEFSLDLIYDSLKFITLIPAVVAVWVFRGKCWESLQNLQRHPALIFLMVGASGYIVGQLLGKTFDVMEWSRNYKRALEESFELLSGPFFVLFGLNLAFPPTPESAGIQEGPEAQLDQA